MSKQGKHLYEFGPFSLDAVNRLLLRDGAPVPLQPKTFDTLFLLVENHGRVLDKDELLKTLWPDTIVEEANLTQNIYILRKLFSEASNKPYIETIPRRGYRFVAGVSEVIEEAPTTAAIAPDRLRRSPEEPTVRAIAVLPFKSLGHEESEDYLGLGVADALITNLSNVRQIITRPTSAVLKYASPTVDPLAAGRELRVDTLLAGHIQRAHERIRVTVQLINVSDGAPLWAEKFDVRFTDIFEVQDSISEQVTRALMLKLTRVEQQQLTKHYTENIEAYQLYLKGRYSITKWTDESLRKAIEFFQQAIRLDPRYALAYAGIADAYFQMATFYLSPQEALPLMREAALKAIEHDGTLAEGHTMLAAAKMNLDWDWAGAEQEYRRALELNPGLAAAHHWYGWFLVLMGRHDESLARLKQAQLLDPLSLSVNTFLGSAYYFARRYDEALEQIKQVLDIEPDYWFGLWVLGAIYERKGQWRDAIAVLSRARRLSDSPIILATLGWCYVGAGQEREARQTLDELQQMSEQRFVSSYLLAITSVALGERDQAFAHLAKACEDRDENVPLLKVDPRLDSLRTDPRFADLLRRAGLAP